jgi:hypothetical protein
MRIATIGLAGSIALLAIACGSGPNAGDSIPPTPNGVHGVVVLGPMCPVLQENSPCPDQPIRARLRVTTPDGASFVTDTDAQGRFELTLDPGRYVIQAVSLGAGQSSKPTPFEVPASGNVTGLIVRVDSGIR